MITSTTVIRADAVVIGSGPGGAVTADALAAAGLDVVVVEEGPSVEPGAVRSFSLEQMQAQYRNAGLTVALGRPPVAYAEGRCVGGGSEINSGLYHRAPAGVLEQWRVQRGLRELTPDDLAPFEAEIESTLGLATLGSDAPTTSTALATGANTLGWQVQEVPRWVGPDRTPCGDYSRRSMSQTYLPRAEAHGARVLADTSVTRLRTAGGRVVSATAVRRTAAGPVETELRAATFFVCAGAVQSPALLRRSGLGGDIGRHLQVHPTVKAVAAFDEPLSGHDDVPVHQIKEFAPALSFGGSASRPGFAALGLTDNWSQFGRHADEWERLAVYYAAIQPQGTGRVRVVPGLRDPIVTYRLTRGDLDLLRSGLGRLIHLLLAAGARTVFPAVGGAGEVRSARDVPDAVAAMTRSTANVMTVHLFSSIPMGEGPGSPVDSFGRVRGLSNLVVNDASLLPSAPGVNPQGMIMSIAMRNVHRHLGAA